MRYVIGLGVVVMLAVGLMAGSPEGGDNGACCFANGQCNIGVSQVTIPFFVRTTQSKQSPYPWPP